jgi:hypothetical protein
MVGFSLDLATNIFFFVLSTKKPKKSVIPFCYNLFI